MSSILTLERPMVPRAITLLYWLAIFLIAVGLLRGVVVGVREMGRSAQMPPAAAASATTPTTPTTAPTTNTPSAAGPSRGGPRFGMRRPGANGPFRTRIRGWRFHRSPMMSRGFIGPVRGMSPIARGGLHILGALVHAAILLAVVRILADVAGALWAWLSKRAQA